MSILNSKIRKYNRLKYGLFTRNCNHFSDELLKALGVRGVDSHYMDPNGLRTLLRYAPGANTIAEMFKVFDGGTPKWD